MKDQSRPHALDVLTQSFLKGAAALSLTVGSVVLLPTITEAHHSDDHDEYSIEEQLQAEVNRFNSTGPCENVENGRICLRAEYSRRKDEIEFFLWSDLSEFTRTGWRDAVRELIEDDYKRTKLKTVKAKGVEYVQDEWDDEKKSWKKKKSSTKSKMMDIGTLYNYRACINAYGVYQEAGGAISDWMFIDKLGFCYDPIDILFEIQKDACNGYEDSRQGRYYVAKNGRSGQIKHHATSANGWIGDKPDTELYRGVGRCWQKAPRSKLKVPSGNVTRTVTVSCSDSTLGGPLQRDSMVLEWVMDAVDKEIECRTNNSR